LSGAILGLVDLALLIEIDEDIHGATVGFARALSFINGGLVCKCLGYA
jgi:hypothetical protein